MDFLYNLYAFFPYKSLIVFNTNTLTVLWVVVAIVIFVCFSIHIWKICSNLKINIEKAISDLSEVALSSNGLLKSTWNDYHETFIDFFGSKKTDEFSCDFFNEKNLLSSTINLKMLNSVNSILVGFGILGTFVGLTYGIGGFSTETKDFKQSIQRKTRFKDFNLLVFLF